MPDQRVPMSKILVWPLIKQSGAEWSEDKASKMAASLAYYTVSSLAPLLVVALGVASLVAGKSFSSDKLKDQIASLTSKDVADSMTPAIQHANSSGGSLLATIFGIIVALFSAGFLFGELQDSLNTIWEVKPKPDRGLLAIVKDRFLSMTMVLGVAFLLLVSTVLTSVVSGLSSGTIARVFGPTAVDAAGGSKVLSSLTDLLLFFVTTGVVTVLFAGMFKILPDVKIRWRDVWLGAFVTALLFQVGKFVLAYYLGHFSPGSAFGAVGSILVLLVWVYYSAQILYFGAEFTQVYANQYGSHIVPTANAEPLTEKMREQAGTPHKPDSPSHPDNLNPPPTRTPRPRRPAVVAGPPPRSYVARFVPVFVGVVVGRYAWKRYHRHPTLTTAEVLSDKWSIAADKWKKLGRLFAARRGDRFAMTHGPAGRTGPSWEDLEHGSPAGKV